MEEKKWQSKRKKRRKKSGFSSPLLYIVLGVALFFGVVYGGELVFRLLSSRGEETPPPLSRPTPAPLGETVSPAREEEEVILYFTDPDFTALVGEKRKIPKSETWLEDILKELLRGPRNSSLFNPIPQATRLNAVFQDKDIVYVDLSEEMMRNQSGGTSQELLSVYAIVDTLTAIPGVKRVKILINGKEESTLCGHVDVSGPLERDEKLIAQVR